MTDNASPPKQAQGAYDSAASDSSASDSSATKVG